MTKKRVPPTSPLRQMMSLDKENSLSIDELLNGSKTVTTADQDNQILTSPPGRIRNWHLNDRPETELGDIESLAAEFRDPNIGQQQPCVVRRVIDDPDHDYEVIVGERRWRAALFANVDLKIICKALTDKQASIIQIAENFNREDLSDYAEGMSLSRLIKNDLLSQKEIVEMFNMPKKQVSRLLSFSQVPSELWEAVGDMSKVSARTASEIRALINKNPENLKLLINLAPKIRDGKLGSNSLIREIEKQNNHIKQPKLPTTQILDKNLKPIYKWKFKSTGDVVIEVNKETLLEIDQEVFLDKIGDLIRSCSKN